MIADRLKLNDDKTEFMIIGTGGQLGKVNVSIWNWGRPSNRASCNDC